MSAHVFTLPDLGEGLTEAQIVRWLVADGDVIEIDQPVVEVETAKAVVEVPSPHAGRVATRHAAEGATLDVGAPLLTVADAEEAGSGNVLVGYGTKPGGAATRRRRPRAATRGEAPRSGPQVASSRGAAARSEVPVSGAGPLVASPGGAAVRSEVPVSGAGPLVASPLVRRLARDSGVDLSAIRGTGPGGLITRRDVEAATADSSPPANLALAPVERAAGDVSSAPITPAPVPAIPAPREAALEGAGLRKAALEGAGLRGAGLEGAGLREARPRQAGLRDAGPGERRVPLTGFRKAVSAVLSRSRAEIPEATVWVDVDATALWELRERTRDKVGAPGLLAYVARFVVAALREYPVFNARLDTERQEIVELDEINLGVAVQTGRGLVVPAVMGAQAMTATRLDAAIREVTERARRNESTPAELTAGTFTLNNYGAFRVDGSAAIINHPQVAILGLGRIIDRPWVVDGALAVRKIAQLSFVFDHRVCDGGAAAGFMRAVADAIEDPMSALARL